MVRVRITGYPKADFWATGVVTEVLGDKDSLEPYIEAILVNSAIPIDFQAGALEEAKAIPKAIPGSELQTRRDLRSLSFVTIDGETAKDFDDAVCLVQGKDESSTLYVAIADVAHYVSQGGAIDTEAQDRGTSVYYPSKVVPMLPFELSWGLCSLNPNEDRLVMVAELCYGPKGGLKKADFYPAVIKSRARLTYTQVNELLHGDASPLQGDPVLAAMLLAMERLAKILHGARVRKGSLDFDLPETLVMLSQEGAIEGILRGDRGWAERLIEEFMIAANVAVARFLFKTKTPCLFRIHEPPDPVKLRGFLTFVKRRGVHFEIDPKKKVSPKDLARFLDVIQGRSDARVLHYMLLRSLMRAQYHPAPKGHFGLALGAYAHFTSPIRRYPDLFVHRMLKARLSDDEAKVRDQTQERVLELAQKTSKAEQRATEVERAMVDLYRVYYGKDRVGETFTGYISSVLPFGFFVELDEAFLEGLVHISQIGDDYYLFDEQRARLIGQHRGRIFGLGDRVSVKIARADLKERKIDFVLAEEPETLAKPKWRKRPGRKNQKRGKTA
jgi:ribonuclease R